MSHTRGPWEWSEHTFNAPPFEGTLEHECGIYPPTGESGPVAIASGKEDARRIVACVNACDGLDTALLERIVALGGSLPRRLEAMTSWERSEAEKQRDDLTEAIRLTLDENGHLADGDVCTLKRLKDALAKVGAGETAPEGHNAK